MASATTTATPDRNFTAELRDIQTRTSQASVKRDNLIREAGSEERRLQEAYDQLHQIGLVKAANDRLSVAELENLLAEKKQALGKAIDDAKSQLDQSDALFAEYEAVA